MILIYCQEFVINNHAQMENIKQKFGKRVRALRVEKQLSQEKLASLSNIHRTYIGGIERGERNPSLKNIKRIADALGITLLDLFRFDNKNQF